MLVLFFEMYEIQVFKDTTTNMFERKRTENPVLAEKLLTFLQRIQEWHRKSDGELFFVTPQICVSVSRGWVINLPTLMCLS